MSEIEKISWAPKVVRARVWQLYQNDALGAIDEALVVDVGFSLWLRCKSIVMVTLFQVECPRCRQVFDVGRMEGSEAIECPTPGCGWQVTGEQYHASWSHRDLLGSKALTAFQAYVEDYPRARSSAERMFCIDHLLHAFHWDLKLDFGQSPSDRLPLSAAQSVNLGRSGCPFGALRGGYEPVGE